MIEKAWIIYKRELASHLLAPLSYVLGAIFLLASGYRFSIMLLETNRVDFYPILFRYMTNVLLIFIPLLTMGLLAGERERGSIALLFTSPVDEWSVVLGKWAAIYTVILAYLAMTLPLPAMLFSLAEPDQGPILAGYLGMILLSSSFCAIGILASALSNSSMVAAVLAFGISLGLALVERLREITGDSLGPFFEGLSYIPPCRDLFSGVIYVKDLLFFLSLTFFFLFATQRMLCSNRWR